MKEIPGYDGLYLIDEEGNVFSVASKRLLKQNCRSRKENAKSYRGVYLSKNGKSNGRKIHRLLAQTFIDNPNNYKSVDHKDGDTLNNSLSNLRWVTTSQNNTNKPKCSIHCSSKYKGVSWSKQYKKWETYISFRKDGKKYRKNLGRYSDETVAALVYNKAAIQFHGEYACLNVSLKVEG